MSLVAYRHPTERWLRGWSGLALLLLLTACAATAGEGGMAGVGTAQIPVSAGRAAGRRGRFRGSHATTGGGTAPERRPVAPRLSELGDPRAHRDFVDARVTAVGFGITAGGYLLYCEGLPLPVLVPESQVDLGLTSAEPLNASIYPDRDTALADMAASASGPGHAKYAYYRGAGGALIVPTLFSPATTPRIARTMLEVRQQLAETTQRELKVLLLSLTGTKVLQGVFSRVVRLSAEEPALRPLPRRG